jgi:hypothetical protein
MGLVFEVVLLFFKFRHARQLGEYPRQLGGDTWFFSDD